MKNYVKVVAASKHIDIFPVEDTDEEAVMQVALKAEALRKMYGGRIVVWAVTGFVARHIPGVEQVFKTTHKPAPVPGEA